MSCAQTKRKLANMTLFGGVHSPNEQDWSGRTEIRGWRPRARTGCGLGDG